MSEKLLFENNLNEAEPFIEPLATVGSNGEIPAADETTPGVTGTTTADIAKTEPKIGFANSIASLTLPATLGFVQPLSSPAGYVFGLKSGPGVNAGADDLQITRRSVETGLRQVTVDVTDEVYQDITSLFGPEFNELYKDYLMYDGKPYDTNNPMFVKSTKEELANFFISYATWKMSRQTNTEFIAWMALQATEMGTVTPLATEGMDALKFVVAEMLAKVYEDTGKAGRTWVLSSPKIINLLMMVMKISGPSSSNYINRRVPTAQDYNYVFTMGNTDFYQDADAALEDTIYAGIVGGADSSSIFYSPYKEYFIAGGEDYNTGQSNVFFRLRDAWTTNPLDSSDNDDSNDSDYIVTATLDLTNLVPTFA